MPRLQGRYPHPALPPLRQEQKDSEPGAHLREGGGLTRRVQRPTHHPSSHFLLVSNNHRTEPSRAEKLLSQSTRTRGLKLHFSSLITNLHQNTVSSLFILSTFVYTFAEFHKNLKNQSLLGGSAISPPVFPLWGALTPPPLCSPQVSSQKTSSTSHHQTKLKGKQRADENPFKPSASC